MSCAARFAPFLLLSALAVTATGASLNVEIVVEASLYAQGEITGSLERYMTDLRFQGYTPILTTSEFATAEDLRTHLSTRYSDEGLAGAVFVGDLPVARFEQTEGDAQVVFPLDLYFTDLDGDWWDLDKNGRFEYHVPIAEEADLTPEIFLGRLAVSPLLSLHPSQTESDLLNAYFDRNHAYRTGELALPQDALMWVDDDWSTFGQYWGNAMGASVAGDVEIVSDTAVTTADDYIARIGAETSPGYESVFLAAHSNSRLHEFRDEGAVDDRIYSSDISEIDPQAFFYHLFACWSGDYTKPEYIAGEWVFGTENGLLSLATTKKGGILVEDQDVYFDAIGEGKTYGEATQLWFEAVGEDGYDSQDRFWNYGVVLLGDPLLTDQDHRVLYLPGDLNGDGFVGAADLDLVRKNWGRAVTPGDLGAGDATGDGLVNSADLDLVRLNWLEGIPAAVPEPGLAVFLVGTFFAGVWGRRSRR